MSNAGASTSKLDSLKVSEGTEGEDLGKLLAERASTDLAHDVARSFRNGYKLGAEEKAEAAMTDVLEKATGKL